MFIFNSTIGYNWHARRYTGLWISLCIVCLMVLFHPEICFCDEGSELAEISLTMIVQGMGSMQVPVFIRGQDAYISITDVFDYLKIKNFPSPGFDSVSGFFIMPQASFLIESKSNRIYFQDKVFDLQPGDLIRTETGLYLRSNYFGEVFGLECQFNFRTLSVILNSKLELPVIREMRLAEMRKNIDRLKGEMHADTVLGRNYPLFHFGMADWNVNSIQQKHNASNTRFNLTLGGTLAGGEAMLNLNYYSDQPFIEKQQSYLWRYANNKNSYLRQVMAGRINTRAASSISSPVVGAQLTNTPTNFRRSYGSYLLNEYTEPDWMVELYVNNVLIDYMKADASGFFTFEVPLVYGNSDVKLRFYGPWGEEKSTEQNISIPYMFLPQDEFEYTIGAAMVEDKSNSLLWRSMFNYGIDKHLTVGGGIEYLSSVTSGKNMPFISASVGLPSNLLFSGEYIHGVRSKRILSYHLPSSVQFELNYTVYDKNQTAISNNYREERKFQISSPFRFGSYVIRSRLNIYQIVLPYSKYFMADIMLVGNVFGVSTNITTHASYSDPAYPNIYGSLSLSYKFPAAIMLRTQTQYDYTNKELISMKGEWEKKLFGHSYLKVMYEKYFKNNINSLQIGLRYEFPFAQTNYSIRRNGNSTAFSQDAGGSLIYDNNTDYLGAHNRVSVGRGGIVIVPFLDLNSDGERQSDEPKVSGLNFHSNGGRMERNDNDTTIYIFDLEPYTTFYLELSRNSFDNMSWQIQKPTIAVFIDPNQVKLVDVPITVVGEVSGRVLRQENNNQHGLACITVCFYNNKHILVAHTLTEYDGFFTYLGLAPGSYTAQIDTMQLQNLQISASPTVSQFNILPSKDGDVVDTLSFIVKSEISETKEPVISFSAPKDTVLKSNLAYYFTIQIGVFRNRTNAEHLAKQAKRITGYNVFMVRGTNNKLDICYLGKFSDKKKAEDCMLKLKNKSRDFFNAFILPMPEKMK